MDQQTQTKNARAWRSSRKSDTYNAGCTHSWIHTSLDTHIAGYTHRWIQAMKDTHVAGYKR